MIVWRGILGVATQAASHLLISEINGDPRAGTLPPISSTPSHHPCWTGR
jgi:hypothetical protein